MNIPNTLKNLYCNLPLAEYRSITITKNIIAEKSHASYLVVVPRLVKIIVNNNETKFFVLFQCKRKAIEVITKKKKYISVIGITLNMTRQEKIEAKNPASIEIILFWNNSLVRNTKERRVNKPKNELRILGTQKRL